MPTVRRALSSDDFSPTEVSVTGTSPDCSVWLDTERLDAFEQLAWLFLLGLLFQSHACRGAVHLHRDSVADGLVQSLNDAWLAPALPRIQWSCDGTVPDGATTFVVLSDAGRLFGKLLTAFSRFHLFPRGLPTAIDPVLFYELKSGERSFDGLETLCQRLAVSNTRDRAASFLAGLRPARPRVALLSSIFNGDEFLEGFLENSTALSGYAACEHFLVRAGNRGNEHDALLAHVRRHSAGVYINLPRDPGLYETWNLCARLAIAPCLSNANIDDRRAPEQVSRLAERLENNAEIDVASAALRVTETPNLEWSDSDGMPVWFDSGVPASYSVGELFKSTPRGLASRNIPHCLPVWRRRLHAFHGYFREGPYGPSADWEFWLRVGAQGVRFGHDTTPMGLYLKRPDSYWGANSEASIFDERIVTRYASLVGQGHRPIDGPAWPMGLWVRELQALAEVGAALELVTRLICGGHCWLRGEDGETARKLLGRLGAGYLGVAGFVDWLAGDPRHSAAKASDLAGVLVCLVDVLHLWRAGPDRASDRGRAGVILRDALVDLYEQTGDIRALIGLALLRRRQGLSTAEDQLLRWAHDVDATAFWGGLQDVYRFEVPIENLVRIVLPEVETCSEGALAKLSRQKIWFFPDYREGNAYQALLYGAATKRGLDVTGLEDRGAIPDLMPKAGQESVFHLHWEDAVFKDASPPDIPVRMAEFLRHLRSLKRRGIKIYWTIHNAVGHDAKWVDTEIAFRKFLVRLVDRVYIQHPLVLSELGWLLSEAPVWLTEHGPYECPTVVPEEKSSARTSLGLSNDDLVLLHFGKVKDYKDLHRYLPGLGQLMREDPRLKLIIAGQIASRSVLNALKLLPEEQVIVRDRFVKSEELQTFLEAADYTLLSYRSILTSGSLIHALSAGVPVIAPRLGTLPAYVVDGWNGFLYGDENELVSVIRQRLTDTERYIRRLAENAEATGASLTWTFC